MTEGTTESFVVADLSAEAEAQPDRVPANRMMQAKSMKGDVENRREINAPIWGRTQISRMEAKI